MASEADNTFVMVRCCGSIGVQMISKTVLAERRLLDTNRAFVAQTVGRAAALIINKGDRSYPSCARRSDLYGKTHHVKALWRKRFQVRELLNLEIPNVFAGLVPFPNDVRVFALFPNLGDMNKRRIP